MAGFSTRLREKIESTRYSAAASHVSSNNQPKNIRGLTRLGGSSGTGAPPSGGLLSGRLNNSCATGNSVACNAVPLPVQTSCKESGGQEGSMSVVDRSLHHTSPTPASGLDVALLGGSKIVPGWGAGYVTDTINAPSGHLGGIKSRDRLGQKGDVRKCCGDDTLPKTQQDSSQGKRVPWALHQPSSPPSTLPHTSLSRRRWGDEDDDSDDEFPQIRSEICKGKKDEEQSRSDSCHEKSKSLHGLNRGCQLSATHDKEEENSTVESGIKHLGKFGECMSLQLRNCGSEEEPPTENKPFSSRSNFEQFELDGRNDSPRGNEVRVGKRWGNNSGQRCSSRNFGRDPRSSPTQTTTRLHARDQSTSSKDPSVLCTAGERNDRKHPNHSNIIYHLPSPKTPEHRSFSRNEEAPLTGTSAISSRRKLKLQPTRDPSATSHQGLSKARLKKGNQRPLQKFVQDESMPIVLLRSCDSNPVGPVDLATSAHRIDPECSNFLRNLNKSSQLWSEARTGFAPKSSSLQSPNMGKDEVQDVSHPKEGRISSCMLSHRMTPVSTSPEVDKVRTVLAIEQQQNVLRQVVHLRAAAVAASSPEDEDQVKKANGAQWERGLKLMSGDEGKKCPVFTEKTPEGFRLESHLNPAEFSCDKPKPTRKQLERSESCNQPDVGRPNSELNEYVVGPDCTPMSSCPKATVAKSIFLKRANPCRIEGHSHDWNDCPHNPKSESFIRNNPCRIEGHDHDWIDCTDNPKSDHYVKPIKKGRRGVKHSSPRLSLEKKRAVPKSVTDGLPVDGKRTTESGGLLKDKSDRSTGLSRLEVGENEDRCVGGFRPAAQTSKEFPESVEVAVRSDFVRPFVPAPPPAVSAWTSGPPLSIAQGSLSKCAQNVVLSKANTTNLLNDQATSEIQEQQKVSESVVPNLVSPLQPKELSSHTAVEEKSLRSILPTHGALFPGNYALFGGTESDSVYESWNPPPSILPDTSVDPWTPNSFSPISVSTSLSETWFGSIWSHDAVSLVTSRGNNAILMEGSFSSIDSRICKPTQSQNDMGCKKSIFPIDCFTGRDSFISADTRKVEKLKVEELLGNAEYTNCTEDINPLFVKSTQFSPGSKE